MQQMLGLMYREHRQSLAHPENVVKGSARNNYPEVLPKSRRQFMMDEDLHKSLKLTIGKQKEKERKMNNDPAAKNNNRYATKEQMQLLKKYANKLALQKKLKQKNDLELPKITHRSSIRKIQSREYMQSSRSGGKYSEGDHSLQKVNSGQTPQSQKTVKGRKERKKVTLTDLRICIRMIIFCKRLLKNVKLRQCRVQQIKELSIGLEEKIQKQINNHYTKVQKVNSALFEFIQILKSANNRQKMETKRIISNMINLTESLKNQGLRRDLVRFLSLITKKNSPLPDRYFSQFELARLYFKKSRFQLQNINKDQVRMIVGMFLGIKLLCNYIFYGFLSLQGFQAPKQLSKTAQYTLKVYTSYFYHLTTKLFENISLSSKSEVQKLYSKKVTPYQIIEQKPDLYEMIVLDYSEAHKTIKKNVSLWIDKITDVVLKYQTQRLDIKLSEMVVRRSKQSQQRNIQE